MAFQIAFTAEQWILLIAWLGISYLGLDVAFSWYKIKGFDKIIHAIAGIFLASFMVINSFSVFTILWVNAVLAYLFEWGQIWTQGIFKLKNIGFKGLSLSNGLGDILFHMAGTIGYLWYKGLIFQ